MRSLLPNNAAVYLETDDLAKMLESLTDSPAFRELTAEKPEFSTFENMQIAVMITGFQTSEENAALNFKPQFVAVAKTDFWSWQVVSFAENHLDKFVRKNYGDDAKLETREKDGGKFFDWTAADGRKVFAFVQDNLIYFGNDAAAIETCLAVKNGTSESLLKNESLARAYTPNILVFGFVSSEGIKQIAQIAGVSVAVDAIEEAEGRNFIARILPQILQNTTKEIVWTANKSQYGIEDKLTFSLTTEVSSAAKEIFAPDPFPATNSLDFLPADFFSATRYNLKNPLTAWHGLLLITAKNADALSGRFLIEFSGTLLEPYGISNAEVFLSSIEPEILTAEFDAEGEKTVVIVTIKDEKNLKNSISKRINFKTNPVKQFDAEIWLSADKEFAAAFVENKMILGAGEQVLKCLEAKQSGSNFTKIRNARAFSENKSTAFTFGKDIDSTEKIVQVLADKKDETRRLATFYSTETAFTDMGIERKTISDFGLIGTIVEQIKK